MQGCHHARLWNTPWVTRHRPKIDRIACPWLIRRFIDPSARFLFVAPTEVEAVAERFGAIPFDIEGVTFSHRGDQCSFDALLDDFQLHTEALDRMATVIRGADTDRHDLAPQAAGLLRFRSACHGCFAMTCNSLRPVSRCTTRCTAGPATGTTRATTGPQGRPE
jgi:hypothetical protein